MLSERFRLIVNRLRVENRSPSGNPESLFLVIPDMCDRESLLGGLKKSASGVLARLSCSRTHLYAPRAKRAAALLDGTF